MTPALRVIAGGSANLQTLQDANLHVDRDQVIWSLAVMCRRLLIRIDRRTNTARAAEKLLKEVDQHLVRP